MGKVRALQLIVTNYNSSMDFNTINSVLTHKSNHHVSSSFKVPNGKSSSSRTDQADHADQA